MTVIVISILLGVVGTAVSLAGVRLLSQRGPRDPHGYWALGLVALAPAWLVALMALLPSAPGVRVQVVGGAVWILSAAGALVGAIGTESRVRRLAESETAPPPKSLWRLGLVGMALPWFIALIGHAIR